MPSDGHHRGIDSDYTEVILRSSLTGERIETPDSGVVQEGQFLERSWVSNCDRSHYSGCSYSGPGASWAGIEVQGQSRLSPPWTVALDLPLLRLRGWAEGNVAVEVYCESQGGDRAGWRHRASLPGGHPVVQMLLDDLPGIAYDWLQERPLPRDAVPGYGRDIAWNVNDIVWALRPRTEAALAKLI